MSTVSSAVRESSESDLQVNMTNTEEPETGLSASIGMTEMPDDPSTMYVPYSDDIVGDPDTGVVHGGVITALLDSASGHAVRDGKPRGDEISIATLDLRIDYMRPADPGQTIYARADCYKKTKNVAFVRAWAFHDDPDDPIATSVGTFMLGTRNTPRETSS